MERKKISVVVSVYNEELSLNQFYKTTVSVLDKCVWDYELIFVNDGSQDGSIELLKGFAKENAKVKVVDFSRNFGHEAAMIAGIDHAQGLELPKHTFYVDNIFVFEPLPYVKNMYYVNTNFYRYFIGREDQSVNESVMISRIDQQLSVNKRMIDSFLSENPQDINCRKYMINYLRIMMEVSSIFLIVSGTKEHLAKKKALWQYAKDKDEVLYKKLRHSLLGWSVNIPTSAGRWISKQGYKIANNIIGFN